jgi:DNA helicase-2/ATP-dependent DNA helicase PcrA
MDDEKAYLLKTIKILEQKSAQGSAKLSNLYGKLKQGVLDQADDYSQLSRGQDLSNSFGNLSVIESRKESLEKEQKIIKLQQKQPYFARIDFVQKEKTQPQKIYIGIGNIIDNKKLYAVDWRSPIASVYYDFSLGEASFKVEKQTYDGNITLKRQFKIEDGQLLSYFDTDLTINDDILQDILSQNVTIKMKQIVSTIQKEQNVIVRNNLNESMLIQGVAGSGKTSIALHRAAYLLYKHRKTIKSSDICIISPNNVFSSYISEVLPQLGEDNLSETTFSQMAKSELKKSIESREDMLDKVVTNASQEYLDEISYKSSYEYLDDLLRFLKGAFLETYTPETLSFVISENEEGVKDTIEFSADETKNLFFKTFKGLDLYERINKIAWQYAMYFTEKRHYSKEQNRALKERFKHILYNFLPIRDIDKIYQVFMAREGFKASMGATIKYMDKGTYLAIKHFIYGLDHDFSAKYLIIDEMQDFTPVDMYVFKKIYSCPMIVVGDINQCIEKNVKSDYLNITADFLGCKLLNLDKTYRSTKEIATFANNLIGLKNVNFVNRSGDEPIVIVSENQEKEIKNIIEEKCATLEHIAIICKCHKEAKAVYENLKKYIDCALLSQPEDYASRVLITTCATAKGIEFDGVIIPNCDRTNYHTSVDKNIIYVSSTRALHKLFFLTDSQPSVFLNGLEVKNVSTLNN